MSVELDTFLDWAQGRFDGIRISGDEVKLNSIFCDDFKSHLWVNVRKSVYHCWKSDEKGSICKLVMLVDHCPYDEAAAKMGVDRELAQLEQRVMELFAKKKSQKQEKISLPPETYWITSLPKGSWHRRRAEYYLNARHLPVEKLMVCLEGRYRNRIVIPYFDKDKTLFYFNCRDLTGNARTKYIGPPKECGVIKGEVLWMDVWCEKDNKVYLTEGEFDAMTLNMCGLNGVACGGKHLSNIQIEMLRPYKVVIALDNDNAGTLAKKKIANSIKNHTLGWKERLSSLSPPKAYKDWNNMFCNLVDDTNQESAKAIVREYIKHAEKPFDEVTMIL